MEIAGYIKNTYPTSVNESDGLPVQFSHGLNRDDDAVTVYPAGCNMTTIDLSTDASTVVSSVPALLIGIYINVAVGTAAATVADNTTDKLTLPVGIAAGTNIDCHAAKFNTNLTVNPADTSTGSITVFWMAQ